ncbi:MAG: Holliday junction branch migration protein RuvA [bacterium]|nr:Holliday junction branch migration protein RuvA [bacterium]MDE0238701.1 Holliday junction branch migration protein RuvA [bacterium]MDE0418718.1 Holliday junction branch migration protein RuvA [bacterium]
MIGRLTGRLEVVAEDRVILDVQGVGYRLACSARTVNALAGQEGDACLLVETIIRDDRIVLYGFADAAEQSTFTMLTTVQGVGPRGALAILSVLGPHDLVEAVRANDRRAIARANGVGQKLATRIIAELADRLEDMAPPSGTGGQAAAGGVESDAIAALVNLGYTRSEAWRAVTSVRQAAGAGLDALIRASLKELAR